MTIGRYEAAQSQHDVAVDWLERARDVLQGQSPGGMDNGVDNLQSVILQNLARALMHLPSKDAKSKALRISEDLSMTANDKLASLVLRIDLLKYDPSLTSEGYLNTLLQFVRTIPLNESFLKTFLQYFHKLRTWNALLAHTLLEVILEELSKSTTEKSPAVVEKIVLTMIWSVTTSADMTNAVQLLERSLSVANEMLGYPIAADGSHAAQVVKIDATLDLQAYALTAYIAILETCGIELQAGKIC